MRNWNISTFIHKPPWRGDSDSTYEELKLYQSASAPISNFGFRLYLWGIETYIFFCYVMVQLIIQTLPMRNWNFDARPSRPRHLTIQTLPMRNWNYIKYFVRCFMKVYSDSTYEELKLTRKAGGLFLIIYSDSTYEELKPDSGIDRFRFFCLIQTLPMRNWNHRVKTRGCLVFEFRLYLWGIETRQNIS